MLLDVVLVAGGLLFAQGNPIVTPPLTTQTQTKVDVTVQAPPPDPKLIAEASVTSFQAVVVDLLAPTLVGWVNNLLDVPDIYRVTDPGLTYQNDGVRSLANQVRTVALGLVALALVGAGLSHMLGQQLALGRVLFSVVLAIGELTWWEWGVGLNNAINNGISAPDVKSIMKPHLTVPTLTTNPVEAFGPAVLVVVYAVVCLMLLVGLAFRLGFLDILIAIGPLALLCKATPQTDGLYSKYVALSVGTLFSQVMIVVALKLAPIVGGLGSGIVGTLLGIVVLLLARRMPALLSSATNQDRGTFAPLLLLRRVVLRH